MSGSSKGSVILMLALFAVIFFHVLDIANLPKGLYLDETSIGVNAASIAAMGLDEHGVNFPVYFKAFGEYKNPVYIYLASALFKVFGVSVGALRMTSCIFFFIGLIPCLLLIRGLAPGCKLTLVYSVVCFGFSPILFVLSRISFEVISHFSFVGWMLYLTWLVSCCSVNGVKRFSLAALLGVVIGLSVYSYSTARMLSAFYCVSLIFLFFNKKDFLVLVVVAVFCLICLLPYFGFAIENQGALTGRFKDVSYVDDDIGLADKFEYFFGNYVQYFSPNFLLLRGDGNLRHAIGYGGEIFFVTAFLAVIGLVASVRLSGRTSKFNQFIVINLLFSPVAAALTSEGTPHALRGMLAPIYVMLLSCIGLSYLSEFFSRGLFHFKVVIVALLGFESLLYLAAYFVVYPERSIEATESYNTLARLQEAVYRTQGAVYFVNDPGAAYANAKFYMQMLENPSGTPIQIIGDREVNPQKGDCVVYHYWNKMEARLGSPAYEHAPVYRVNWLQELFGVKDKPHPVKIRCY